MMSDFDKKVTGFFRTYQDRGMKKWQGFFLSDHTLAIKKDSKQKAMTFPKKSEMTQEEISAILLRSFSDHYQVSIQRKTLNDDGLYQADIVGFVQGYDDNTIIISNNIIELDDINHVELLK